MITTGENLKGVSGIYAAIHRDSGMCYVGSSVNMGRRLRQHLRASEKKNAFAFHRAIAEFSSASFDFEVLERCEVANLRERERFYIAMLNACSADGFNTRARPGLPNYGYKPSEATKSRIRERLIGRPCSPETRRKISEANKGRKRSSEERAKTSEAVKAALTPEIIAKISEANRSRKSTPQSRAKASSSLMGCIRSEETKAKMRLASKARMTLEVRDKLRKCKIGWNPSAETREKMRVSAKKAFTPERQKEMLRRAGLPEAIEKMRLAKKMVATEADVE